MPALAKKVKPNNKGRISLGKLADGVSSFAISIDESNRIILEPYTEIPAREKWVYEDKKNLKRLKHAIADAAKECTPSLGYFTQYVEGNPE